MSARLERVLPLPLARRTVLIGLIAALVFQGLVLVGMYALSALPLMTGTEIRVKTIPVDPRSLFRGNYAMLRYDISRIKASEFAAHQGVAAPAEAASWQAKLRMGERVYVQLQSSASGLYEFSGVQLAEPAEGIFLRGRVRGYSGGEQAEYHIEYGIEAFFAPKEKALALERQLSRGGVAVLKVTSSGNVRLVDVIASERP
jgi:uncharacterized membrane-anchored protein